MISACRNTQGDSAFRTASALMSEDRQAVYRDFRLVVLSFWMVRPVHIVVLLVGRKNIGK